MRVVLLTLRMDVYTTLGRGSRAVEVGLDYLRRVGIDWSPHPTEDEARREYERVLLRLGGRIGCTDFMQARHENCRTVPGVVVGDRAGRRITFGAYRGLDLRTHLESRR